MITVLFCPTQGTSFSHVEMVPGERKKKPNLDVQKATCMSSPRRRAQESHGQMRVWPVEVKPAQGTPPSAGRPWAWKGPPGGGRLQG